MLWMPFERVKLAAAGAQQHDEGSVLDGQALRRIHEMRLSVGSRR